jgi:hypothetical protein
MEMPKPRLGLREFFLQIGSIITLYVSAITLLSLLFEIIDYAYRPLNGGYYRPSISWPVAMLIVIFPLFVMFSWMLQRAYDAHPDRKTSILRRILVYITIFLSIGVIAGDLIAVLYYYLDGQIITTGFMLKVLAVFCVAVLIFVYYISDLRNKLNKKTELVFISIAALIVILSVGFGFSVLGSPRTQRLMRIDENKIRDLEQVQNQITNYWSQKGRLPQTLSELNDSIGGFETPKDPDTNADYVYQKTAVAGFKLCTTFNTDNMSDTDSPYPYSYYGIRNSNWKHSKGNVCFDRTIDPELYPPRKTIMQ